MLKFFTMQGLWEAMGEGKKADELDKQIREDSSYFKVTENNNCLFKEQDEEQIFIKYPQIKEKANIHDFETYLEWNVTEEDITIGCLTLEQSRVSEFVINWFTDGNIYDDDEIFSSDDADSKINEIVDCAIGTLISLKLKDILIDSKYELDFDIIKQGMPE